jgi:hypothetical protein
MDFADQKIENVAVKLDGNTYRNCTFYNVTFHYAGGDLDMKNCVMDRFRWQFDGDLARGLDVLRQLYGAERMLTILRGFVDPPKEEEVIL